MNHVMDVRDSFVGPPTILQVQETAMLWHKPQATKAEAASSLMDREPGSFIIRNSTSCTYGHSLALKVGPNVTSRIDSSVPVVHYLLKQTPTMDGRGVGLHLADFVDEPIFPTLAAFVQHHLTSQGSLPILLRLPHYGATPTLSGRQVMVSRSQQPGFGGNKFSLDATISGMRSSTILYLGSAEVYRSEDAAAVKRAVTDILNLAANSSKGLKKMCPAVLRALPGEGVSITGKDSRLQVNKSLRPNQILYCGMDPDNRIFNSIELTNLGVVDARLFGIVVRKQRLLVKHETVVYVMCEVDRTTPITDIIFLINHHFLGVRT